MTIVNPQWLQDSRTRLDDEVIVKNLIQQQPKLQKVMDMTGVQSPKREDYTKFLDLLSGSGSTPMGSTTQTADQALGDQRGFFARAFDSLKSVPERFQRSFGSEEVREGRTETSKGFDLADLPGDIADVAGKAIPVAASMVVGGAATLAGLPLGGVGAFATGTAGASAGAATGEVVRQGIGALMNVEEKFGTGQGQKFDAGEVGKEAAFGAVGQAGGQLVAKGATKLLAPFASRFTNEMIKIANLAKREGVDLPVSAISESKIVGLGQAAASKGFFGSRLQDTVNTATKQITEKTNALVRTFSDNDSILDAGITIGKSLDEYEDLWRVKKNALYQQAEDLMNTSMPTESVKMVSKYSPNAKVPGGASKIIEMEAIPDVNNTIKLLERITLKEKSAGKIIGKSAETNMYKKILKNLKSGQFTFKDLIAASDDLGKAGKHGSKEAVSTGDTAITRSISATLDEDIMGWISKKSPDIYESIKSANEVYKEGIRTLNSTLGQTIEVAAQEPLSVIKKVFKPESPNKAKQVLKIMLETEGGVEKVANVQAAFLRQLLKESQGKTESLIGKRFNGTLDKYGLDLLHTVLGKDATDLLHDYAKLSSAIGKSQAIAAGSQTSFLLKYMAAITALTTGAISTAVKIVGSDAIMSKLFTSRFGNKWMTEGIRMPNFMKEFIKTSGQIAPRAADNLLNNN